MNEKKSTKMGNKQYQDFRKAQHEGDEDRAQRIYDLGYQPNYEPSMLYIETEVVDEPKQTPPPADTTTAPAIPDAVKQNEAELDEEEVLADVAAGLENKEITEKYGISAQKLGAIKKKAK